MQNSRSSTRGRAASASYFSSSRRHHQQRIAFRGPLSLLWLALSVGTGPAACFVVLPTSTRVAAASPLPKVVLGSRPGARNRSCDGGSSGANRNQRRLFAFARGRFEEQEGVAAAAAERGEEDAEENTATTRSSVTSPTTVASSHDNNNNKAFSTGIRNTNARTIRAVTALSRGEGFRAAATELRASAAGTGAGDDVAAPTEDTAAKNKRGASDRPKRILILMSDTGGGHRASSQALSAALENLYGDQVYIYIYIWIYMDDDGRGMPVPLAVSLAMEKERERRERREGSIVQCSIRFFCGATAVGNSSTYVYTCEYVV